MELIGGITVRSEREAVPLRLTCLIETPVKVRMARDVSRWQALAIFTVWARAVSNGDKLVD